MLCQRAAVELCGRKSRSDWPAVAQHDKTFQGMTYCILTLLCKQQSHEALAALNVTGQRGVAGNHW
jgi:hypothetical protein